jgi:hypothetical protein
MLRNKIFVTSQPKGSTLKFVKGKCRIENDSYSRQLTHCCFIDIFQVSKSKEFPQTLVDDRLKDTNGDLVGVCIPYEIDTKYYTAKVDFWLDEIDRATEEETIKAYCEKETEISKVIDAFVFIFDKSDPTTFDTVKNWTPFLEQAEPGIKICLGTKSEEPLTMGKDAEVNDWCLSNGFDYVDMDETTETPMDKVGMDLALDIIQTNFWDGMVKKNVSGVAQDEDLLREIQELKLQHDKDILKLSDDGDKVKYEDFGTYDFCWLKQRAKWYCIYRYSFAI